VAITATGKSSAATSGKVVAADTSLRIAKPANASLRTAKTTASRSAAKAATPHTAAVEAAAASVHPTATATATTSHRWRSKRESERECRRSNRFEISHKILFFLKRQKSLLLGEVLTTFIVPKVVSHCRAQALAIARGLN
jgi:hypothetical protein